MAKIFNVPARAVVSYGVNPTARFLLRIGVTPNAVTVARHRRRARRRLLRRPRSPLLAARWIVTVVRAHRRARRHDGPDARARPASSARCSTRRWTGSPTARSSARSSTTWPAQHNPYGGLVAALICLAAGQVVSYVKARAESLGLNADVGIAERLERLLIVGVGGLLGGAGLRLGPAGRALGAGRCCR